MSNLYVGEAKAIILDLKEELCLDLIQQHPHEISVGELKVFTDEELVDRALKASCKGGSVATNSSPSLEEQSNGKTNDRRVLDAELVCFGNSGRDRDCVPSDKTREEYQMAEVEALARIKQKQEDEKSAARLHSFTGASGTISCVTLSLEKKEQVPSLNATSSSYKVRSASTGEQIPVHGSEILLCVEIYDSRRTSIKTQEILVLGQQALTEMRDKIHCSTDEIMRLSGQHDPSGYFFIEDIFYNDLREASATDYSRPILDWLKESKDDAVKKWEYIVSGELQQKHKEFLGSGNEPKLPQLKSLPIQGTRFCDLSFRLGSGYLYCHQGDCKHVIVIRDMRLIHPEDVLNKAAYPLIIFQSRLRFRKCNVCKMYRARKVTVNDKWAADNPCYFCEDCYYRLHYADNALLYDDFLVYDYIHE